MPEIQKIRAGVATPALDLVICPIKGVVNYTKLSKAVQGYSGMVHDITVYHRRIELDDWFSVHGMAVLSKGEYFLLRFILARTIHYGKLGEIITKDQFVNGVRAGAVYKTAPCGLQNRELYKAVAALSGKGILRVRRITDGQRQYGSVYEVDVDTLLSLEGTVPMIKQKAPKNAGIRVVSNDTTPPTRGWYQMTPQNIINKYEDNEVCFADSQNAPRGVASDCKQDRKAKLLSVVKEASDATREKREAKIRRGRNTGPKSISLQDLNATWKQCMVSAYGSCTIVGLTVKEFAIFRKIVKPHELEFAWVDFFTWVIQSWSSINATARSTRDWVKQEKGDWSLRDAGDVRLGTEKPELFRAIKNLPSLLKLYAQRSLPSRRSMPPTPAATLAPVPKTKPRIIRREVDRPKPVLRLVDPATDTFFDETDSDLPEWGQQWTK